MGWASGSELAESTWLLVRNYIPANMLDVVARNFIAEFENLDCDTMNECEQLIKDAKLEKEYWAEDS